MSEKYKEGQLVKFDNGVINGVGKVRGIATVELTCLGVTYILERYETNIKDEDYPYTCIAMFECYITGLV